MNLFFMKKSQIFVFIYKTESIYIIIYNKNHISSKTYYITQLSQVEKKKLMTCIRAEYKSTALLHTKSVTITVVGQRLQKWKRHIF